MAKTTLNDIAVDTFLVWVYQRQKARFILELGVGLAPAEKAIDGIEHVAVTGDGTYQIQRSAAIGADIDYSGSSSGRLHNDAELAHHLVMSKQLSNLDRGIILAFGESGLIPEYGKEQQNTRPVQNKKGVLRFEKSKPETALDKAKADAFLSYQRSQYGRWWGAMMAFTDLAREHVSSFTRYRILPPSKPQFPWL